MDFSWFLSKLTLLCLLCLLSRRTDLESFSCAVELKRLQVTDCSVLLHKCLNNDIKILRQELQLINYNPGIIYQLN